MYLMEGTTKIEKKSKDCSNLNLYSTRDFD